MKGIEEKKSQSVKFFDESKTSAISNSRCCFVFFAFSIKRIK